MHGSVNVSILYLLTCFVILDQTEWIRQSFFKQKTAYAILRSDWSSDVCSSD
eukprot:COSAG01_NODE_33045_length_571_cov_0.485169_1_plen_51_part_01